jgi:CreA protein
VKKVGAILGVGALLVVLGFIGWIWSRPERGATGQVSTRFRWLGPNDRIVVDGFDDPKVQGVACHVSRAVTGGVKAGSASPKTRAMPASPAGRSVPSISTVS